MVKILLIDRHLIACDLNMISINSEIIFNFWQVGLFSAVALVIGNIIGSGIFVSPGYLLARYELIFWLYAIREIDPIFFLCSAGSPGLCLVLWGVCGVYSLLGESILIWNIKSQVH
jgi:L-type amino acid transporter 9